MTFNQLKTNYVVAQAVIAFLFLVDAIELYVDGSLVLGTLNLAVSILNAHWAHQATSIREVKPKRVRS